MLRHFDNRFCRMRIDELRRESRIGENSASGLVREVKGNKCNSFRSKHLRSFTLLELLIEKGIITGKEITERTQKEMMKYKLRRKRN